MLHVWHLRSDLTDFAFERSFIYSHLVTKLADPQKLQNSHRLLGCVRAWQVDRLG